MPNEKLKRVLETHVYCNVSSLIHELLDTNKEGYDKTYVRDLFLGPELRDEYPFEYYAVSAYLFEYLKEKGEAVTDEFARLYIWGRCTTGQHIYLDAVFAEFNHD